MIYLISSIILSTLLGISFKVISVKNINSFQAIVVNYIVAGSLGFITTNSGVTPLNVCNYPFVYLAVALGFVFIASLFAIAETTSKYGVSVAQVSNRMSLVVPITIAILFYGDGLTVFKIIGIVLAISAVYLVLHKESEGKTSEKLWWLLPLIVFVCGGIIDSSINYAQKMLVTDLTLDVFLSTVFASSFVIGTCILLYQLIAKGHKFEASAIPAGILLGVINYGTMYLLGRVLASGVLEPSVLFPVNNLSVLLLSTIISVVVYHEKLSRKNWIGIGLSLLAIFILGLLPQLLK